MMLSEYTPTRADTLNKLFIPEIEAPIPTKFLWLDVMHSAENGQKIYSGNHLHSFYEVHFVVSGEITYECGDEIVSVPKDHALLIPPGVAHRSLDNSANFLKASFAFLPDLSKEPSLSLPQDRVVSFVYPRRITEDIDRILLTCETCDAFTAYLVSAYCLGILYDMIRALEIDIPARGGAQVDPRFDIAKSFIRNNKNRLIFCEDVAKECCLSSKQLNRIFKQHTGKTLFEYIVDSRLRYAQNLLLQSGATIKEIGYMLGFENESSFISFFKRQCGMPPSAFRKQGSAINDVRYTFKEDNQ